MESTSNKSCSLTVKQAPGRVQCPLTCGGGKRIATESYRNDRAVSIIMCVPYYTFKQSTVINQVAGRHQAKYYDASEASAGSGESAIQSTSIGHPRRERQLIRFCPAPLTPFSPLYRFVDPVSTDFSLCASVFFSFLLIPLNLNRALFNLTSELYWGRSGRSRGVSSSTRPRGFLKMRSRSRDNSVTNALLDALSSGVAFSDFKYHTSNRAPPRNGRLQRNRPKSFHIKFYSHDWNSKCAL